MIRNLILILILICMAMQSARAALSVTVTAGHTFAEGEVPTVESLNELGLPIIVISGTIGGSNTLSPGSVTGVSLADSLPDGGVLNLPAGQKTMGWDLSNPRELSVNSTGLCDGIGCVVGNDTNSLAIYFDPTFFLASTNSMGNTNLSSLNTGNAYQFWFTMKAHSIYDGVIAPGGISSASITNVGLLPTSLNSQQIITNIYQLPGSTWTNTVTNYGTVFLGNGVGLGTAVNLGPGLSVSNVPTVYMTNSLGTPYYATSAVPTLEFAGFNGSLPLEANIGPWTNNVQIPTFPNGTNWTGTNFAFNAYDFGGQPGYTNNWGWAVASAVNTSLSGGFLTNAAGGGTNGNSVIFVCRLGGSSSPETLMLVVSNTVYDASGQRAMTQESFLYFHQN